MSPSLIDELRASFQGVTLNGGVSLNGTEFIASWFTKDEYDRLSRSDEQDDWTRIDDATLSRFPRPFSFFDANGFRFHAPAYMIYSIRHHRWCDSLLVDCTISAMDPDHHAFGRRPFVEVFSPAQIQAIMKFLMFFIANDIADTRMAKVNLRKIRRALEPRPRARTSSRGQAPA